MQYYETIRKPIESYRFSIDKAEKCHFLLDGKEESSKILLCHNNLYSTRSHKYINYLFMFANKDC